MLMMLLTSCNSTSPYIHTCPVSRDYSQEYKTELKREVALAAPNNAEIKDVIEDYSVLVQGSKDCWSK